jgi:hypothetical protein
MGSIVSPMNARYDSVTSGGNRQRKGIGFHTSRIVDANSVEPKLIKSTFKKQ